jgi:hypothetical protein
LIHSLKWSFDLCKPIHQQAFLDIVAFYEPLRLPWEIVSIALQEGNYKEVGNVIFYVVDETVGISGLAS